jgi:uncharacterized protein (TIGR02118 family)
MSATLLVLVRTPQDVEAFERRYREVHLPLVRRLPGLRQLEVGRTVGGDPQEREYHLVARLTFDDRQALRAALRSPEGQAAMNDLAQFAVDGYKTIEWVPAFPGAGDP